MIENNNGTAKKYCPYCGTEMQSSAFFCRRCGRNQPAKTTVPVVELSAAKKPRASSGSVFKKVILSFAVFTLIAAVCFTAVFFASLKKGSPWALGIYNEFYSFSENPEDIAEASSSVVMLHCYDKSGQLYSSGSGFALFEDGVIVTNYHVIEYGAYSISAMTESGLSFEIDSILCYDADLDIAILKTNDDPGLALLKSGDVGNLEKAEKVVAIGSPLGLINSVSTGVYSGMVSEKNCDMLQFTAAISHGSSGGALFDDDGYVVGITTASFDEAQNVNLAVPIEDVERLWARRSYNDIMSISEFYELSPSAVDVDLVLSDREKYMGSEIIVTGYVSYLFGYAYEESTTQIVGIVSSPNNVIGDYFSMSHWDESNVSRAIRQNTRFISMDVLFMRDMDMEEFYEKFPLGEKVTIKGYFYVEDVDGFDSGILLAE